MLDMGVRRLPALHLEFTGGFDQGGQLAVTVVAAVERGFFLLDQIPHLLIRKRIRDKKNSSEGLQVSKKRVPLQMTN